MCVPARRSHACITRTSKLVSPPRAHTLRLERPADWFRDGFGQGTHGNVDRAA